MTIPIKSFKHKAKHLAKRAAIEKQSVLIKNFKLPVISIIKSKHKRGR